MSDEKNYWNDIADDLRGKAGSTNWFKVLLISGLLIFTAGSTLRLFSKSFAELGPVFAFAAIFFFDGGYVIWGEMRKRYAKSKSQEALTMQTQTICAGSAISMTLIDMVLHSGQDFIALNSAVTFWGWEATIYQAFGGIAIIVLIGNIAFNIYQVTKFDHIDVDISLAIETRHEAYREKQQELSMNRAAGLVVSNSLADTIQAMHQEYESKKGAMAHEALQVVFPKVLAIFKNRIRNYGTDGDNVIDGKFKSEPHQRPPIMTPPPVRAYAKDMEEDEVIKPIPPVPPRPAQDFGGKRFNPNQPPKHQQNRDPHVKGKDDENPRGA